MAAPSLAEEAGLKSEIHIGLDTSRAKKCPPPSDAFGLVDLEAECIWVSVDDQMHLVGRVNR